jgi:hypothetical protein
VGGKLVLVGLFAALFMPFMRKFLHFITRHFLNWSGKWTFEMCFGNSPGPAQLPILSQPYFLLP